jgi:hypothetical protein
MANVSHFPSISICDVTAHWFQENGWGDLEWTARFTPAAEIAIDFSA